MSFVILTYVFDLSQFFSEIARLRSLWNQRPTPLVKYFAKARRKIHFYLLPIRQVSREGWKVKSE